MAHPLQVTEVFKALHHSFKLRVVAWLLCMALCTVFVAIMVDQFIGFFHVSAEVASVNALFAGLPITLRADAVCWRKLETLFVLRFHETQFNLATWAHSVNRFVVNHLHRLPNGYFFRCPLFVCAFAPPMFVVELVAKLFTE
jgi:hypothetical protein